MGTRTAASQVDTLVILDLKNLVVVEVKTLGMISGSHA